MSGVASTTFSCRAPEPPPPAAELLAEIRARGGRVYRMRAERVFCLTDDPTLADWLYSQGAKAYAPVNSEQIICEAPGGFWRARDGKVEYDLWLNTIPVEGSLWEAAA